MLITWTLPLATPGRKRSACRHLLRRGMQAAAFATAAGFPARFNTLADGTAADGRRSPAKVAQLADNTQIETRANGQVLVFNGGATNTVHDRRGRC